MVPESCRWVSPDVSGEAVKRLALETGYPENFACLLAARGVRSKAEAESFLDPGAERMYDPFLMKGMQEAVKRICAALDGGEKICIYGDYDVDGITATSILFLFLREYLEMNADSAGAADQLCYYLPDRMSEGYGMNEAAVRSIAAGGTRLIITVDTGISAVRECGIASELGMDVIISDHHECQDTLPAAEAVIDAKQAGETYPFLFLAGCGVAFKIVQGLAQRLSWSGDIGKYLELAAVGTVADIVDLSDENRIIVSEGFRRIRNTENIGLRMLLKTAGYDFRKKLTSGFIGFSAAPRLNAGGRMGDAARGVKLFTTADADEALAIAEELDAENTVRRETEQKILEEVTQKIDASPQIRNSRVIVVSGEGWHQGVIGIVSSRIKDRYYRPNIIFSLDDGIATGSARSIPGFDIFEALCSCSDLFIRFGGHAAAAGMSLEADRLPELSRRLNEYAAAHMNGEMLTPSMVPEIGLDVSEATPQFIHLISMMEPFGQGMPEPLVRIDGMLSEIREVGADRQTLRLRVSGAAAAGGSSGVYRAGAQINAIAFRKHDLNDFYSRGMAVSVVGNLSLNSYMGREYPQIIIRDMRSEIPDELRGLMYSFSLRHVDDSYAARCDAFPRLQSSDCARVYRMLRDICVRQGTPGGGHISLESFVQGNPGNAGERLFALLQSAYVFEELGLIALESSGPYMRYSFNEGKTAVLRDSQWFRRYFEEQ